MLDLTFGEQVKIILSRRGMTIKELAETIEKRTGKKMSRQNLTQRLGRDNFQEQDMRLIAGILECPFHLDILGEDTTPRRRVNEAREEKKETALEYVEAEKETAAKEKPAQTQGLQETVISERERDITIGELVEIHEELDALIREEKGGLPPLETPVEELLEEVAALEEEAKAREKITKEEREERENKVRGWKAYLKRRRKRPADSAEESGNMREIAPPSEEEQTAAFDEIVADAMEGSSYDEEEEKEPSYTEDGPEDYYEGDGYYTEEAGLGYVDDEDRVNGEVNPYTGREYETNSVRIHPNRIGYVQVYDRNDHKWTDMTEWAFLGYQERKKALLGDDYEPPIYLD